MEHNEWLKALRCFCYWILQLITLWLILKTGTVNVWHSLSVFVDGHLSTYIFKFGWTYNWTSTESLWWYNLLWCALKNRLLLDKHIIRAGTDSQNISQAEWPSTYLGSFSVRECFVLCHNTHVWRCLRKGLILSQFTKGFLICTEIDVNYDCHISRCLAEL